MCPPTVFWKMPWKRRKEVGRWGTQLNKDCSALSFSLSIPPTHHQRPLLFHHLPLTIVLLVFTENSLLNRKRGVEFGNADGKHNQRSNSSALVYEDCCEEEKRGEKKRGRRWTGGIAEKTDVPELRPKQRPKPSRDKQNTGANIRQNNTRHKATQAATWRDPPPFDKGTPFEKETNPQRNEPAKERTVVYVFWGFVRFRPKTYNLSKKLYFEIIAVRAPRLAVWPPRYLG